MQLIAMMLTTAITISMWNNLPVEKSLDWHNTINLQGAGARNKLLTALGLQQYWGALETCLCLCLLACWLPHLGAGTMLQGVFGSAYMLAAVSAKRAGSVTSGISSKVSQLARVQKCVE
jgi:hypothetical protein